MADGSTPAHRRISPPPPTTGPGLYGVFDVSRPDRIAGWAIDRSDAAASVDGRDPARGRDRSPRPRRPRTVPTSTKGGVGGGDYGFSAPLDPPVEPGFEFTLAAFARAADGTTQELRRPSAQVALRPEPPAS